MDTHSFSKQGSNGKNDSSVSSGIHLSWPYPVASFRRALRSKTVWQ